jgi:sulfite reductase (NADPH) flavoprotein alpha-component
MSFALLDPQEGPLPPLQSAQLDAPATRLSPDPPLWPLGGPNQQEEAAPAHAPRGGITILFASQTGNAMKVAQRVAAAASARGLRAVTVSAGDYLAGRLCNERNLILITSTKGEGDPPDSAIELRRFLFGKRAPALAGLRYAVLALGDYNRANFCKAGSDFDHRLQQLGAKRLLERVDCDVDYQVAAEAWQERVLDAFGRLGSTSEAAAVSQAQPELAPAATAPTIWDKAHPFRAPVLARIDLNRRGSAKKTVHLELSLTGSAMTYQPGDSLGILPSNSPAYVQELLAAIRLAPHAPVLVDGQEVPLAHALGEAFEITTVTRSFVKAYAADSRCRELVELVHTGREFQAYAQGRDILDVLFAHPPGDLSPQSFVGMLRRLQPRLYSITSSLRAHAQEAHLLVGLTRYQSHGRQREGVCSGFVCERLGEDQSLLVYPSANPNFRLPQNPDAPVIMIGPGTGVAPFRAFLEEREVLGCGGPNWLFFGEQHADTDFLYQRDWERWHQSGLLSRLDLAFSRDQPETIYVQHRMLERSRDIYAWLQEGATVYVCGNGGKMPAGVRAALVTIVSQAGAKSCEAAEEYVQSLQSSKRYQRDVY